MSTEGLALGLSGLALAFSVYAFIRQFGLQRQLTQIDGTPIPGWGIPRDVMDFFLFLALSDWRAVARPPPPSSIQDRWEVGLIDSSGSALAGSAGIRASGNQDLLADLMRHHESWEATGCPALEDWHVTLTAHDAETRTPADVVVNRANYRQVVTRAT